MPKSGTQGLSLTQQTKIMAAIQRSRDNDRVGEFYETGEGMLNKRKTDEINILLRDKIILAGKLNHNRYELNTILRMQSSGKYPEMEKELERKSHIGDEVIYNQQQRIKELSCARIAAIFDISQQAVTVMESKLKRCM